MIDDKHSGIINILNLSRRSPVKTPKVVTQEFPSLSISESLMNMKSLELPKSETRDEYGYTKKQNQEIERQLTKDTSKSKGAWSAFVKANTDPNKPKKIQDVVTYIDKMNDIYGNGRESAVPKVANQKIFANNINSKRYVNKSLNSFENRTENKSVVTFDPTTQLFTDDTRNIAFKDYKDAKAWNDKVNGQPTATGEQVNYLKARLDNARAYGSEPEKDNRKQKASTQINKHRRLI